jgi:outer membrane immunogenic protein
MKNMLVTASVFGVFAALHVGSAIAADMPAPFLKAPAPVYNWTGCYLGGGGGYGMWNQDSYLEMDPAHVQLTRTQTNGGKGWFGTVSGGCDYQVNSSIVVGAFADGDWGSLSGTFSTPIARPVTSLPLGSLVAGGAQIGGLTDQGSESEQSAWAVGARIGWLVAPTVLTYWDGGYTLAYFSQINLSSVGVPGIALGLNIPGQTYNGWFLGGGFDYALPFFSGLFWQTEYRYATYNAVDLPIIVTATGLPLGRAINSQVWVQTVRSELVFRFNWSH